MAELENIDLDDNDDKYDDPYFNFINSIKSESTKVLYENNIKLFMKFCKVADLSDLLKIDAQRYITRYVMSLRDMKLASNSIKSRLNPVFHFYEMNDVALNKKKIKMFRGEFIKKSRDREYTHKEIKKILDVCDLRMKVVILLMSSTGCRVGALPSLRLRNLQKIKDENLYRITIYEGSNEQYFTYCTPECASYIDDYLKYRESNGEKIGPDSFLIRDQFNINDIEQIRNKSRGVTIQTIHSITATILLKAGLRTIDHTSRHNRKEIMKCHGFRKFFATQCGNSKVDPEVRERLLGHNIGLALVYVKPTPEEILAEYQKAINNLTINEENRLLIKVRELEDESNEIKDLKRRINENTDIVNKLMELAKLDDGVGMPFRGPGPMSQRNPEFLRHMETHTNKEKEIFKYLEARGIKLPERFYSL